MNIPIIGWIAAAIMAIIVAVKLLWDNCKGFREVLFGVWESAKAVFHNIGVVVGRLWDKIVKPIFNLWWNFYKSIFVGIWNVTKSVIVGIGDFFSWLWNSVIQPVGQWIWDFISGVFLGIWEVGKSIWNWLTETFSGFFGWINDAIVKPIYEAFSKVWHWLTALFDKIMNKLKALIQPIVDLWNSIFSDEGMKDVSEAYEEGKRKGAESFERDQKAKQEAENETPVTLSNTDHKSIFDVSKGAVSTPTIGGVAAHQVSGGKQSKGEGGGGSNKVQSLNINTLIGNLTIQTTNLKEGKQKIVEQVKEAMLTAVADFATT